LRFQLRAGFWRRAKIIWWEMRGSTFPHSLPQPSTWSMCQLSSIHRLWQKPLVTLNHKWRL
jgi:hypothetical protein